MTTRINPDCPIHGTQARARAAVNEFTPPDPYAAGIKKMREDDAARTKPAYAPPPTVPPGANEFAPPDPYAEGLRRMREEMNR